MNPPCPTKSLSSQRPRRLRRVVATLGLSLGVLWTGQARAQVSPEVCGALDNGFGPFDYRADHYRPAPGDLQSHKEKLRLVESVHFPRDVELLLGGSRNGAGTLWGDLDYVLRAFPNHHRALASSLRWYERTRQSTPTGMTRPLECVFERAIRFRPDDTVARLFYATYLLRNERRADAVLQIDTARKYAGDNAFAHYNVGLLYADANAYDQALEQAHKAMDMGLGLTLLAQRLKAAGRWKEPGSAAATATAEQASSATDTSAAGSAPSR
jgi:tetratricopeptide (TPR) repeat protein